MAAPAIPVPRTAEHRASRGLWRDAFRRLLRNGPAVVGLILISIFVLAAVFAPVSRRTGRCRATCPTACRSQAPST